MKKVGLLILFVSSFVQVCFTKSDHSEISQIELNKSLVVAVRRGDNQKVLELLQSGADRRQTITYDAGMRDFDIDITTTFLEYAVRHGNVDNVKIFVEDIKGDDINKLLIMAVDKGYSAVVKELIKAGADVNYKDTLDYTPLIKAVNQGYPGMVKELIKLGADVNHATEHGDTALIKAIKNHDLNMTLILLETPGINVNCANTDGNSALMIALNYVRTTYISGNSKQYNDCMNSQKIIEKLVKAQGVDFFHTNNKGETAVSLMEKMKSKLS